MIDTTQLKKRLQKVKNLVDAVNYKNKEALLLLEDYAIEEGALKLIGEKGQACLVIDVYRIIKSRGIARALELGRIRSFLRFCKKYNVKYMLACLAPDEKEMRTARELVHVGLLLDLSIAEAKKAVKSA